MWHYGPIPGPGKVVNLGMVVPVTSPSTILYDDLLRTTRLIVRCYDFICFRVCLVLVVRFLFRFLIFLLAWLPVYSVSVISVFWAGCLVYIVWFSSPVSPAQTNFRVLLSD